MKKNPFELLEFITKGKNPFRDLSKEERLVQARKELELKEGIKRLALICNDILNDQRYREFADLFKSIEKQIDDLMIDCDEPDRDKFYLKMKEYQIKLRMFSQILKMPHEFIAKADEIKNEKRSVS